MSADGRMGNRRSLEVNVGVSGFWWGAVVVVQTRLRFDVRGGSFLVLRVGWVYLQRLRRWASALSRTSSVSFSSGVSWRFSIRVGSRASLPPRQAAPRHGEETMSLRKGRRKRRGFRRGSPGGAAGQVLSVDRGWPGDVDRGDCGDVDRGGVDRGLPGRLRSLRGAHVAHVPGGGVVVARGPPA